MDRVHEGVHGPGPQGWSMDLGSMLCIRRTKRQVHKTFYNMRYLVMFVTAVCLLFLLKLKWPKNKSVYDVIQIW